jgi:hypothetical protein
MVKFKKIYCELGYSLLSADINFKYASNLLVQSIMNYNIDSVFKLNYDPGTKNMCGILCDDCVYSNAKG